MSKFIIEINKGDEALWDWLQAKVAPRLAGHEASITREKPLAPTLIGAARHARRTVDVPPSLDVRAGGPTTRPERARHGDRLEDNSGRS